MTSLAEEEVQGEKEEERRRALCRAFCRKWDSDESLTETVLATLNGAFDEDEDGGEDQDDVAEDLAHRVEEKIEEVADVLGGLIEALEEAGDGERESATRTLLLEWVGARKGAGSVGTAPVSGSGISSPTVQSSGGGDDLLSAAASASATNCEPLPGVPTVLFALEDAEIERTEPEVRRLRDMGIIPGASPLLLHYLLLRANGNADHAVLEGLAIANRGEVAARNEELSRRRTKHLRSEERRDREERLRAEEERKALVARFGERAELVKGHDQNRYKKRKAKRGDGKAGIIIEEVDQDGSVNTKKNKKAVLMNVAMGSGKTAQDAGGKPRGKNGRGKKKKKSKGEEVRFLDGQKMHVRKGEKHVVLKDPNDKGEWDGGSRGRVKTKGKRGVGWK